MSTTPPRTQDAHHMLWKPSKRLPRPYDAPEMWIKADIVLTVAFHRLRLPFLAKDQSGTRIYDVRVMNEADFEKLKGCVRAGLGL
jgi:mRNA interferase MazF